MEAVQNNIKKSKGGRPKKAAPKSQQLAVLCTPEERNIIQTKADFLNCSISEFLRTIGLGHPINSRVKTLPKEVLLFTATLNHLAANMNQVARKRNANDELNAIERAELNVLCQEVKQLATNIKLFLT